MTNAGLGLSHALGHQIGPRWNVPHGVTSCITLPHAMRFMAAVAPERFGPIAQAFGIPFDAAQCRRRRRSSAPTGWPLHRAVRAAAAPAGCAGAARGDPRSRRPRARHPGAARTASDRPISREQVESVLTARLLDRALVLASRPRRTSYAGSPSRELEFSCSARTFFRIAITPRSAPRREDAHGKSCRDHSAHHHGRVVSAAALVHAPAARPRRARGFQGSAARRGVHTTPWRP